MLPADARAAWEAVLSPRRSGQRGIFYTGHTSLSSSHYLHISHLGAPELLSSMENYAMSVSCMACRYKGRCPSVSKCCHGPAECQGGNRRVCRTRGCASCPASDCPTSPWRRPRGEPVQDPDVHASPAGPPVRSNTVMRPVKLARGCQCCNASRNGASWRLVLRSWPGSMLWSRPREAVGGLCRLHSLLHPGKADHIEAAESAYV